MNRNFLAQRRKDAEGAGTGGVAEERRLALRRFGPSRLCVEGIGFDGVGERGRA